MSTSVESKSANRYVDFDEYIDYQLQKTGNGIKWTEILTALAGVAVLMLGYFLIFTVLDHWIVPGGFGPTARAVMFGAVSLLALSWTFWKAVLPYFRRVNGLYAARVIETSEPSLKSTLLNWVDLRRAGRPVSPEIMAVLEKRAALTLSHVNVDEAIDRRHLMRLSYALLAIVILSSLYVLFSPKKVSAWRAFLPAADVQVATRTEIFDVQPGDAEVLARSRLEVLAHVRGRMPEEVTLFYTTADRRFVDEPVVLRPVEDDEHQFRGLLSGEQGRGIFQNLTYYIVAGDARTREYRVTVNRPPSATIEEIRYEYPEYMRLDPKTVSVGHIDAWEGTTVKLRAQANMPLKSAILQFSDNDDVSVKAEEIPMRVVDGTTLEAEWTLNFRSDGTYARRYRIQCRNEQGESDPSPTLYNVTIRPDQPPEVALLDPVRDLEMPANAIVPLMIAARDPDFMLRYLNLRIEKGGEELLGETIFEGERQRFSTTYEFHLERLDLEPGDVITYWIEARDNKMPLGNRKNTPRLNIRILDPVGEEVVAEQLEADKERQQERMRQAQADDDLNEEGIPDIDQPDSPDDQGDEEGEEAGDGQDDARSAPGETAPDQSAGERGREQQGADGQEGEEADQPGDRQDRLRNDGSDDDEVLRRLIEQQQSGDDSPESDPSDQPDQSDRPEGDPSGDSDAGDREMPTGRDMPGDQTEPPADPSDSDSQDNRPPGDSDPSMTPDGSPPQPESSEDKGDQEGRGDESDGSEAGTSSPDSSDESADDKSDSSRKGGEEDPGKTGDSEKPQDGMPSEGEKEPAEESPDSERRKADGDETGEGTPDRDPDADPTRAENQLDRKPGEEPETRPSEEDPERRPDANREARDSDDPEQARQRPREGETDESPRPDSDDASQRPSEDPSENAVERPAMSDEGQPDGTEADPQGDQPEGAGTPDGMMPDSDSAEKGDGEGRPEGERQPGEPGENGSRDDAEGSDEGQPGGEQDPSDASKPGGQEGSEEDQQGMGSGRGEETAEAERPTGNARGGPQDQDAGAGEGSGGASAAEAEEANLEYAKEAANLVLKRLEDEIDRGDVDQKLLDELGWNQDDLRRFSERLKRQLQQTGEAEAPAEAAQRRQFEEMLKNLDLGRSGGTARRGDGQRIRSVDGVGPRRLPVPAEYREAYEAYTRGLARQKEENR